jgi:hypothetical protein
MEIKRIIIYPKDVECITGQSGRSARKMMATIREKLGKEKHQLVSIREFCDYTGVPECEVLKHLES